MNRFTDKESIAAEFEIAPSELDDCTILFAEYTYANYEGNAFVLFLRGGRLYCVNGGHCSCRGLEGQWRPELTSWGALARYHYDLVNGAELERLVAQHVGRA